MKHLIKFNEMAFNFKKTESPKKDKLYILVNFAGGDADTEHPELMEFKNIKFSEYKNHLDEIQKVIDNYKILKKVLEDNDAEYSEVKSEYGDDIARLFDNSPNDPQSDYQYKCYIDDIMLIGYDTEGNKYESYIR